MKFLIPLFLFVSLSALAETVISPLSSPTPFAVPPLVVMPSPVPTAPTLAPLPTIAEMPTPFASNTPFVPIQTPTPNATIAPTDPIEGYYQVYTGDDDSFVDYGANLVETGNAISPFLDAAKPLAPDNPLMPSRNRPGTEDWLESFRNQPQSPFRVMSYLKSRTTAAIGTPAGAGNRVAIACQNLVGVDLIDCLVSRSQAELGGTGGMVCRHYSKVVNDACANLGVPCSIQLSGGGSHMWNEVTTDGTTYIVDALNNIVYVKP